MNTRNRLHHALAGITIVTAGCGWPPVYRRHYVDDVAITAKASCRRQDAVSASAIPALKR
jgi:hypothetical protein